MKKFLIITSLIVAFVTPVVAQGPPCGPTEIIEKRLQEKYGETPVSGGLTHSNLLVRLFLNVETRTWTLVSSSPTGTTCLISAGNSWTNLENYNNGDL